MSDRVQALRADVAAAHDDVFAALESLPAARLDRPTTNDDWSAREVLAHLASIAPRLLAMLQSALDDQPWPNDAPDLDSYNAARVAERRDWPVEQLLAELRTNAEATDRFLARLAPSDLDRTFAHPVRGPVAIETLARIIPVHTREHLAEITSAANA